MCLLDWFTYALWAGLQIDCTHIKMVGGWLNHYLVDLDATECILVHLQPTHHVYACVSMCLPARPHIVAASVLLSLLDLFKYFVRCVTLCFCSHRKTLTKNKEVALVHEIQRKGFLYERKEAQTHTQIVTSTCKRDKNTCDERKKKNTHMHAAICKLINTSQHAQHPKWIHFIWKWFYIEWEARERKSGFHWGEEQCIIK